jgi:hypothetical protein
MIQNINEKEYNIESSEKVAEWSAADYSGSFRHEAETLYKTENGHYFIFYEGGLFSQYHQLEGLDSWYGGTHIRPVTRDEAVAWCEETGNDEAIQKYFFLYTCIL